MTIQAIWFDMHGVIVHETDHTQRRAWEKRLGLAENELRRIVFGTPASSLAASGQVLESQVWEQVGAQLGLSHPQLLELPSDFWASEQLDPAMVALIQSLRPRYKVGILSNAWSDVRKFHNAKFKLNTWVDVAVYSAEIKLLKPDPRIYQFALAQLGVPANACLFVDDALVNVQAARALGMIGVHCQNTAQTIDEIRKHLDQ